MSLKPINQTRRTTMVKPDGIRALLSSYANPVDAMTVINLLTSWLPNNKYSTVFKGAVSAGMGLYGIYTRYGDVVGLNTIESKYESMLRLAIGVDPKRGNFMYAEDDLVNINMDIVAYLLSNDVIGDFRVVKLISKKECKEVSSSSLTNSDNFCMIIRNIEKQYSFALDCVYIDFNGHKRVKINKMFGGSGLSSWDMAETVVSELTTVLHTYYVNSLNLQECIVRYDTGIYTTPRKREMDFNFTNIDYNALKNEISSTLERNLRRGIILAGNPGTGKTSVLLQLESDLSYPIVYVSPNNIDTDLRVESLFSVIESLDKAIVVFEDFDGYELEDKSKTLSTLLCKLDGSHGTGSVVYIATVNDMSKLNSALTRAGRFDTIKRCSEPKSKSEFRHLVNYRCQKLGIDVPKIGITSFLRMKYHKFTCSDVCDIVDRFAIGDIKTFSQGIDRRLESRKTVKEFS